MYKTQSRFFGIRNHRSAIRKRRGQTRPYPFVASISNTKPGRWVGSLVFVEDIAELFFQINGRCDLRHVLAVVGDRQTNTFVLAAHAVFPGDLRCENQGPALVDDPSAFVEHLLPERGIGPNRLSGQVIAEICRIRRAPEPIGKIQRRWDHIHYQDIGNDLGPEVRQPKFRRILMSLCIYFELSLLYDV